MHPTQISVTTAEQPARRVDGKPETDADRRFFDLRESGYTGPTDQGGNAVPSLDAVARVVVTVTPAVTLRQAALYLSRHGWVQGAYYDQAATVFTPAACTVGAIGMVCYGGPVDAPALNYQDEAWPDFNEAVEYLEDYLSGVITADLDVYEFNDTKGRTASDVIGVLNAAATVWDRTIGGAA